MVVVRIFAGIVLSAGLFIQSPLLAQPDFYGNELAVEILTGERNGDTFGNRAIVVGDVDDDGVDDIMIGARFSDGGGTDSGRAYVVSGADFSLLHIFTGEGPGDELAHRMSYIGDIDDDGHADIFLSAFLNDDGGDNAGEAYIFSGRDGDIIHEWTGDDPGANFGRSIESLDDVDDDNVRDIIISAWRHDGNGYDTGRVWLFSGESGDVIHKWDGEDEGDLFGFDILPIDDIDDDGRPDIAISAPEANGDRDDSGVVYFYSSRTGRVVAKFDGDVRFEELGRIRMGEDFNGDDVREILVAPWQFSEITDRVLAISPVTGEVVVEFSEGPIEDQFGERFKMAGDVNADGVPDIMISAPRADVGNVVDAGKVYVYDGQSFELIWTLTGDDRDDRFGRTIHAPGDLNGDGYDDLIISSPYVDSNGSDAGRLWAYSGRTGTRLYTISGEDNDDWLGHAAQSLGDLNRDGLADFLVTAPYGGSGSPGPGRVYIVFGSPLIVGADALRAGRNGTIEATGALADESLELFGSVGGIGEGPALEEFGGLTLDILAPIQDVGSSRADGNGRAVWSVSVPSWLSRRTVYLQVVSGRGNRNEDSVKSNVAIEFVSRW